jgi:alpha-mannosidase
MPLTREQRLERLRARLEELSFWRERGSLALDGWRFAGEPIRPGDAWPRRDGVAVITHPGAAVPEAWPLEEVRLELDLGGEGLVRILGPQGVPSGFGLDLWHRSFPLPSRVFAVEAEVVARGPFGSPREPRLAGGRLVRADPDVERLLRRLSLVAEAAGALVQEDVGELLLAAAERALRRLDWPSSTEPYLAQVGARFQDLWSRPDGFERAPLPAASRRSLEVASALLDDRLRRLCEEHPPQGRLALAGHAHLDVAWLWPLEETRRKARRTFHTAVDLLERYPELVFVQSSAELHRVVEADEPELFQRLRGLAAEGRWEAIGGMWVEPDMNMTSGESIVRQLLFGQRFFERALGRRHRVAWLPDCFGFTPALPQLLRGAGMDGFVTCKLSWSETNRFPHDLFWWEGLDGTRILAHGFTSPGTEIGLGLYNGDPAPSTLLTVWRGYRGRLRHPESLFAIGYGDGGGGPTEEMLEDVRALAGFPTLPALAFGRVDEFFERLRRAAPELPVWSGELYLELHRGTLTTQGRVKRAHRRAERDLVAAEVVGSLCRLLGVEPPEADLRPAWLRLLRNQFHDVLPGSSIAEVARAAEEELEAVAAAAGAATAAALGKLAQALAPAGDQAAALVCNPDLRPRPLRVVLPEALPGAQAVEEGWALSDRRPVAGLEVAVVCAGEAFGEAGAGARADGLRLENDLLRVELAAEGTLVSVYDRRVGREALAGPGNQLWVYQDKPRAWDAWDIDEGYVAEGEALGRPVSIEVVEGGPHRAALRLRWRYRSSAVTQTVRLWACSPRLEFDTELDWHERRLLLKTRFPLAVRSPRATFETAFGVVERPTHRNTSWDATRFEVAGHRFADLSEPGYGVALLNDGRYGHHALGSELGLSLLRSPVYPDPLADEGRQRLTYALLPHPGGWLEGGVLMEAEDLNRPLLVRPCRAGGPARRRPLTVRGPALALAALKPHEDGPGLALRLYEPQGARGRAELRPPVGWGVGAELSLIEDRLGPPALEFLPFQVRTYLLEPGA